MSFIFLSSLYPPIHLPVQGFSYNEMLFVYLWCTFLRTARHLISILKKKMKKNNNNDISIPHLSKALRPRLVK